MLNIPIRERLIKETPALFKTKALSTFLKFKVFFFITKKLYNIFSMFVNNFFKNIFYRRENQNNLLKKFTACT